MFGSWLSTTDCVWDGPSWLKSKQRLNEVYSGLEHFFKVTLSIPDASDADFINDLLMLKAQSGDMNTKDNEKVNSKGGFQAFNGLGTNKIREEAEKRYEKLMYQTSKFSGDEMASRQDSMRSNFESSALVYSQKENVWRSPSQCVWAESSVTIPGKSSISDVYPSRKTFFTTVLRVSEPTVEMYIESLKAAAGGKASATQIKGTMALICGLGIEEYDLKDLVDARILPIKIPSGATVWFSAVPKPAQLDFAIIENILHGSTFKGKINILDFTLEEIRDTRPLLMAMGLEKRFSSKLVEEVTEVTGGLRDSQMTSMLHLKCQAIVR